MNTCASTPPTPRKSIREVWRRVKVQVEVVHWECGRPDHHHTTEAGATKCAARTLRGRQTVKGALEERRSQLLRRCAIARAVLSGATWGQVGASLGISRTRVQQIFHEVMRKAAHPSLDRPGSPIPENAGSGRDLERAREHREFWIERIDALEKKHASTA